MKKRRVRFSLFVLCLVLLQSHLGFSGFDANVPVQDTQDYVLFCPIGAGDKSAAPEMHWRKQGVSAERYSEDFAEFERVEDATQEPYCRTGRLDMFVPDYSAYGTGTLIGPRCVLTCAHNLFFFANRKGGDHTAPYAVTFSPGSTSVDATPWQANAVCWMIHKGYYKARDLRGWDRMQATASCDIALILLDRPIGYSASFTHYGPLKNGMLGGMFHIVGYPSLEGCPLGLNTQSNMFVSRGSIMPPMQASSVTYDINTTPGSSGSGVFDNDGWLRGVHIQGGEDGNSGVRLNAELMAWIKNAQVRCADFADLPALTHRDESDAFEHTRELGEEDRARLRQWTAQGYTPSEEPFRVVSPEARDWGKVLPYLSFPDGLTLSLKGALHPVDLSAFAEGLSQARLKRLTLKVDVQSFGIEAFEKLIKSLSQGSMIQNLVCLNLLNESIEGVASSAHSTLGKQIAVLLRWGTALRSLELRALVDATIFADFASKEHYQHLYSLVLTDGGLDRNSAKLLARALPHTQLRNLCLDGNPIGAFGKAELSKVLSFSKIGQTYMLLDKRKQGAFSVEERSAFREGAVQARAPRKPSTTHTKTEETDDGCIVS